MLRSHAPFLPYSITAYQILCRRASAKVHDSAARYVNVFVNSAQRTANRGRTPPRPRKKRRTAGSSTGRGGAETVCAQPCVRGGGQGNVRPAQEHGQQDRQQRRVQVQPGENNGGFFHGEITSVGGE